MKNIIFLTILAYSSLFSKEINLDNMIKKAQNHNKQIMIFIHIPDCPYCESMKNENFQDKKTLEEIKKNFLLEDINVKDFILFKGEKKTHKEFAKSIGIFVFPSTLFMGGTGEVLFRSMGYRNIDEYLAEIKYISSKSYKKISLEKFLENLEFEQDD